MMNKTLEYAANYKRDKDRPRLILFPRDIEWRKELFGPGVMEHPAKMQLHIVKAAMEYWGFKGMKVLDPFAGTGTTAIAATMGYETTLIELEDKFVELLKGIRREWLAQELILPQNLYVFQGDCREVMPQLAQASYDMVLTSPPYSTTAQVGKEVTEFTGILAKRKQQMREYGSSDAGARNIGRLNPFFFLQSMKRVYSQIHDVLKPGGLYVSVTKDSMRAGVRQMLASDVIRDCQESGLIYTGQWYKWKAPGGLLQNVQKSKGMEIIEDEDIIVFERQD